MAAATKAVCTARDRTARHRLTVRLEQPREQTAARTGGEGRPLRRPAADLG
ncbi:hypothetical protein ACWF94_40740 [Streptomyces sp. NPDC055078]